MEARAQARFVRVTPMKARRMVDLIRGLPAADAQAVLRFAPQDASEPVGKVLDSAIANATNNHNLDPASLVIAEAFVDEGPTMKRFRPRAQGRAYRIGKRTSHITVILESVQAKEQVKPAKSAKKSTAAAPAKKAPAKKAAEATEPAKKAPAKKAAEATEPAKKAPAKKAAAKAEKTEEA